MSTNLAPLPGNLPAAPGALGGTFAGASGGPKVSPLFRYLSAIRRFKWLILLLTMVGLAGGTLASRFIGQTYSVDASILIADRGDNGSVQSNPLFRASQWQESFLSYRVIQPVARARRLYVIGPKKIGAPPPQPGPSGPDAALFLGFATMGDDFDDRYVAGAYQLQISKDGHSWELKREGTALPDKGFVGDSIGKKFGFLWNPTIETRWYGQTFNFDIMTMREAADLVRKSLNVGFGVGGARFMKLKFVASDPEDAAGTLNALMNRFVDDATVQKRKNLTLESATLDTQMTQALTVLHSAEGALQSYRVQTVTKPRDVFSVAPGISGTTVQGYDAYIRDRENNAELRRQRDDLANALKLAKTGQPIVDQFKGIASVNSSPDLSAVLGELQVAENKLREMQNAGRRDSFPENKALIERIRQIRDTLLPRYSGVVMRRLDAAIARTDSSVVGGAEELRGIPARSIREETLTREKELAAKTVDMLQAKITQTKLSEAGAIADVEIYDKAQAPLNPKQSKKMILIGMGFLGGLGAGLALALLLDLTDKRVRYADQITSGLGLTILGVIPEISRAKGVTPTPEEAAQVIEAFRTVRLNLSHAVDASAPVTLTISSPSPGDGKSLVSSNLALSFAEAGYRTLLIDGDTRRGELHRTFGAERRPGLLDYLTGEISLAELRRPTSHPQLTLITGGSRKRNAPELLGGSKMRELVTSMRSQYDVLILDSPPLGAGIDPFVLATLTGNLLLVMRAGATERDLAEAKLQIVDQLPIRMVGAILNDVRASMNEYKYYSYSYGYGATDEVDEKPAALMKGPSEG